MRRLTVYQRIMHAAETRCGLLLSTEDIAALGADGAIVKRADLDDAADARGCRDGWHEDEHIRPSGGLVRGSRCPSCGRDD